jgi:hypothetical protein
MSLADLLHQEHELDGNLVLFRCSECGQVELSLGSLHGHVERHRGYTRLGIQLPFTKTSPGAVDQLMEHTDVLRVDATSEVPNVALDDLEVR